MMWDKTISFINALIIHVLLLIVVSFNVEWPLKPHLIPPKPQHIIQAMAMDEKQVLNAVKHFKAQQHHEANTQKTQYVELEKQMNNVERTVAKEARRLDKLREQTQKEQQRLAQLEQQRRNETAQLDKSKRQQIEQARLKQEAKARKEREEALRTELEQAELERKQRLETKQALQKQEKAKHLAEQKKLEKKKQAEKQARLAKEEEKRQAAEQKTAEKKRKLAEQKAAQAEEKKRKAAEQKTAEKAEKQRKLAEQTAEEKKRQAAEKQRKAAEQNAEEAASAKNNEQRINQLRATIRSKIKRRWKNLPENYRGLSCEVAIFLSSSGSVTQVRVVKGSGNAVFDNTVKRTVQQAAPFPIPEDLFEKVNPVTFTLTQSS